MPKKPMTTEGSAASSSTRGLNMPRMRGVAISARYSAVMTPSGIAMSEENTVTAMEATIMGRMPNSGGSAVGYQKFPNRNPPTETCSKMGAPSRKR